MSKWVVNGLAVAIIILWVTSCLLSMFSTGYTPPASIQWAISILAGAAFGKAALYGTGDLGGKQ